MTQQQMKILGHRIINNPHALASQIGYGKYVSLKRKACLECWVQVSGVAGLSTTSNIALASVTYDILMDHKSIVNGPQPLFVYSSDPGQPLTFTSKYEGFHALSSKKKEEVTIEVRIYNYSQASPLDTIGQSIILNFLTMCIVGPKEGSSKPLQLFDFHATQQDSASSDPDFIIPSAGSRSIHLPVQVQTPGNVLLDLSVGFRNDTTIQLGIQPSLVFDVQRDGKSIIRGFQPWYEFIVSTLTGNFVTSQPFQMVDRNVPKGDHVYTLIIQNQTLDADDNSYQIKVQLFNFLATVPCNKSSSWSPSLSVMPIFPLIDLIVPVNLTAEKVYRWDLCVPRNVHSVKLEVAISVLQFSRGAFGFQLDLLRDNQSIRKWHGPQNFITWTNATLISLPTSSLVFPVVFLDYPSDSCTKKENYIYTVEIREIQGTQTVAFPYLNWIYASALTFNR